MTATGDRMLPDDVDALSDCIAYFNGLDTKAARNYALALTRIAVHLRAGGVWQPIESAPRNEYVLAAWPNGVGTAVLMMYTSAGYSWVRNYSPCDTPTHWMPLPEPPMLAAALAKEAQK